MNGLQEMILIGEIVLQSKIAKRAAERLRATHDHFDHVETWCSIQSILVSVGIVSKILWPDKKYKQCGVELRRLLKVDESNPLSNRSFRNHFAHYDERVHEYFKFNSQGVYTDLAMNPHLNSGIFGHIPMHTHRGYNAFNDTVVFRDEILDLNELLIALDALLENCKPYALAGC
ncbi:hypothetical protein DIU31_016365 [Mucilaginibacter rubeus]|uniref:Uncharacterized protein n=1 Tax=Mucilaginibacter rubeus TaxID=2027860 RepID=A0AAE6MIV8_9SPHI|nr:MULTISPECIES: hypothetical protein [Mucilaginibacter]QEM05013.1 hypothetical protein DIU31_016365 [Mucilaginibacter rubeus]QEM17607.1 hypothetical protein DIU38_016530 [Mucilaginibacter gossypii]QTE45872.1 hypothetical protein J3L19_11155 [Mucilaginibacter rubeus]QTE52469.1 hypothetical protein J3L21_11125 [Mucilaginibacter rubeus]QTE57558.1 hypothetical protein J3L23_02800 [Mucilaginibacter rubeus]